MEPLSRYSPVMSHLSPSYSLTVIENPILSLKLQGALSTSINIWVYSFLAWMEDKPIVFLFFFVGTYRPANSHDSPVSRTIFELFSRPHNMISQSHVFWGNIILIWNVTLLNKKGNFAGNASACWSLDGALSHNLAMKVAYWKKMTLPEVLSQWWPSYSLAS